jgi:hypothetical protein
MAEQSIIRTLNIFLLILIMDIDNQYYMKYLKYKKKYINLQKQQGGAKDYAIIFI